MDLAKLSDVTRAQMEHEMGQASIDKPQVGIFWYSPEDVELFGVVSMDAEDAEVSGKTTLGKRHDQVWKKEHFRAVAKNKVDSPFYDDSNAYNIPRGRVFLKKDGFLVMVGKWIEDYPEAKDLLLDEFNLPPDTEFRYDEHWDIGHGWSGDHMA